MKLPEKLQREFDSLILISGTISSEMVLLTYDNDVAKYLGEQSGSAFLLNVAEQDKELVKGFLAETEEHGSAAGYIKVLAATGEYRNAYITVHTPSGEGMSKAYPFTLIDLKNAEQGYPRLARELNRIHRMFEAGNLMLFEYSISRDERSLYRFVAGKREEVENERCDAAIDFLLHKIKSSSSNVERFAERIPSDGFTYVFDGVVLYENFRRDALIGTLKVEQAGKEERADIGAFYRDQNERYDNFTGLYNKVYALEYAKDIIEKKTYDQVLMIMIDIDNFKTFNDTYGHTFGDEVLGRFAVILRETVKGHGIAARFGGDEFLLVLHDIGDEIAVRSVCETISSQFRWSFAERLGDKRAVTCTMGVSEYPRNGSDFDTLFKKSDKALYIGKQKGRHRYIIYKEAIHGELDGYEAGGEVSKIVHGTGSAQVISALYDAMAMLYRGGIASLKSVLTNLLPVLRVSGISIYNGTNFEIMHRVGNYINPPMHMNFVSREDVLDRFSDGGRFRVNLMGKNEAPIQDFYDYLSEHDITTTYQYIIGNREEIKGLVSFDVRLSSREESIPWSDDVYSFMVVFAQFLGAVIR